MKAPAIQAVDGGDTFRDLWRCTRRLRPNNKCQGPDRMHRAFGDWVRAVSVRNEIGSFPRKYVVVSVSSGLYCRYASTCSALTWWWWWCGGGGARPQHGSAPPSQYIIRSSSSIPCGNTHANLTPPLPTPHLLYPRLPGKGRLVFYLSMTPNF